MNMYSEPMEETKMPRGDGTGPRGLGAGTGWGLGPCGAGMRRGAGRGMGFGWRRFANSPAPSAPVDLSREQKLKILEADKADIESELREVDKAIEGLKKE
jgi:hypothetical protein